ncbi:hypothetical protein CDL15_Pgr003233 [Punica granatum]|uniref:F-box domain-containing protein n=1 Tax=Punica granatum TaxID=22663 RepID=A0A218X3Y6_PUNGR|nr:hypothetical protein CDL15_Pgr003233 [Punica granatum]
MFSSSPSSTLAPPLPLPATATADAYEGHTTAATSTGVIHPDIFRFNILTRLDGPTLASASCVSSEFHALSNQGSLWADVCRSTWPSTDEPRLLEVISAFAGGHRSFFSDSYPIPALNTHKFAKTGAPPHEIISAVDIHHRGKLIFSRVVETETVTGWFRWSPFRIDMLEPKDVVPTLVPYPGTDDECRELGNDLTLSWIMIDPNGQRAMNVSSRHPVSVSRHWLSGEVHARFATVLAGERGSSSEFAQCGIVVTCGGTHGGELQVREVSLQVEDLDGMFLNGRDSLVILQRALEGKRRRAAGGVDEGKGMYEEFRRMKMERKEKKLRAEGTLDMLCVAFGIFLIVLFLWIFTF